MPHKEILIKNHRLILGDCLEVLKEFSDSCVDTIVTSPPYNLGIKYNTYKDSLTYDNYLSWLFLVFSECKRILTKNGSLFLNVGSSNTKPWIPYDIAFQVRKLLILQNNIIWVKSISIKNESHGHYKPVNSKRFFNHTHEHIFHFTKTGKVEVDRKSIGVPYKYKCNLQAVTVTEDIRCRGDCWYIPYETIQKKSDKGNHPAIFPLQLAQWCIKVSKGNVILDPFMGSGTTIVAADMLQCRGIGIELDEEYFSFCKERVAGSKLLM